MFKCTVAMSDVLYLRYLEVEVYEKGGKTTVAVQDVYMTMEILIMCRRALSSEVRVSRKIFLQVPRFFARLRKWLTEPYWSSASSGTRTEQK